MDKLVSIIVNCYNGEKYLFECLSSILNQKYTNWEVIFWDNQSTDKSKEIFDRFQNQDERFKYFRSHKYVPLYEGRNLACSKACGEFLAFLDTDDYWDINFLESRRNFFLGNEYDFSYSNCFHILENRKQKIIFTTEKLKSGKIFHFLAKKYLVKISTLILRKKIFDQESKFNSSFNIIGDFEYVMRMSYKYNFLAVQDPLACIRFHEGNFMNLNRKMYFVEYKTWYENINFNDERWTRYKLNFKLKLIYLFLVTLFPSFFVNFFRKK